MQDLSFLLWQVCVTREHIVSARGRLLKSHQLTVSFSTMHMGSISICQLARAPRTSLLGNNNTGWLAMTITRNTSRRQRVSVYKHCKVTHRTAVSSLPFHPRSLFEPLSRVTSRDPRSQRRYSTKGSTIFRKSVRLIMQDATVRLDFIPSRSVLTEKKI